MDDQEMLAARQDDALFGDIASLIEGARARAAVAINRELVMLYWSVGKRVREEVLGGERAAYGERVIKELAVRLNQRYGRGWSRWNLERMMRLSAWLPDSEKCATLSHKLSWSHVVELLTMPEQAKRDSYAAYTAHERWSVRVLRARIARKLYERTHRRARHYRRHRGRHGRTLDNGQYRPDSRFP